MRPLCLFAFLFTIAVPVRAAEPKAIEAAIKKGAAYLDEQFKEVKPAIGKGDEGIGPVALAGLALLESGKLPSDATMKAIASAVRDASYTETRTYQLALCLLFLDRLGERHDEPLIQMLGVRLVAGQNGQGGWTYSCIDEVAKGEEQRLRARLGMNQLVANGKEPGVEPKANPMPPAKDGPGVLGVSGKLHADVEKHRQGLLANARNRASFPDDNSNTQFAILAVWVARRHGVPVEHTLEAIEKRFVNSQTQSGGWPYSGLLDLDGSPSMTCAGLLGLATALGRREERRLKAEPPIKKPEPDKKPMPDAKTSPDDPFFTPPPMPKPMVDPKKAAPIPKKPNGGDLKDKAIEHALDNLAAVLGGGQPKGRNPFKGGRLTDKDMYFLWSLERVGVVYGLDKIGRTDWYQFGADILLPAQNDDGSWNSSYGREVDTSFAILFLAKSNLVRDLSAKVQRDPLNSELRGGPAPLPEPVAVAPAPMPEPRPKSDPVAVLPKPMPSTPMTTPTPMPTPIVEPMTPKSKPLPAGDDAAKLADTIIKLPAASWSKALEQVRDGKGPEFTKTLLYAIQQLDGDRKKQVREALSERLTRMSADTLRGMLKADEVELRRAAVLACAMKDDKSHAPDLIDRLLDDEEIVVRAARAGLKSLSGGQDFGPEVGSSKTDRALAMEDWKAWWAKQKK